jgi:hypothetical protein
MITVFCGPTIAGAEVESAIGDDVVVLPPAAQGDVYRSLRRRPDCIVLIDGYFHGVPAVWHKEILFALSEGVPVIGAASMGALRAAELCAFGMTGVGWIFEAYRDGVLVDDDEVVLMHADASEGYRGVSEPLVNIRRTLDAAVTAGVVGRGSADRGLARVRAMPFGRRSLRALLAEWPAGEGRAALSAWLPDGRVDQKRADALAALTLAARGVPGPEIGWLFERTAMWDEFVRVEGARAPTAPDSPVSGLLRRLEQESDGDEVRIAALSRLLADDLARRTGRLVDADVLVASLDALRHRMGLQDPEDLQTWLRANDLTTDALARLLATENNVAWLEESLAGELEHYVLDQFRLRGRYAGGSAGLGA